MTVRRDLIETCLKLLERAYDVERTRQFYDALIAELKEESPELVERIAARMLAANDRWGRGGADLRLIRPAGKKSPNTPSARGFVRPFRI